MEIGNSLSSSQTSDPAGEYYSLARKGTESVQLSFPVHGSLVLGISSSNRSSYICPIPPALAKKESHAMENSHGEPTASCPRSGGFLLIAVERKVYYHLPLGAKGAASAVRAVDPPAMETEQIPFSL
ncbi:hypothetical protein PVK06_049910 [Gossypium arboreum]|uniref:Uncharacterized protein n=1 Tax=Gossypium arboreum TaxID=29729 RepID=A0ABR0M9E8_GOSAR|nr:hypothetical protein PVK06_049910 [Gossypium arboreum]